MNIRRRLTREEWIAVENLRSSNGILIIGDLHAPFLKEGYLDFCIDIREKYNIKDIIFIGDIVDNHYSSYHETDPDGHSAGEELDRAIGIVHDWYREFPVAKVCIGNHDSIPDRKAMTAGLSNRWLKSIADVIEAPNWDFQTDFTIDGVKYVHGLGGKARQRAKNDLISIVQGHYHSESYIEHFYGDNFSIFACQIGCGIDRNNYAMAYGKHFKKMHINCAVVLEGGTLPIIESMKL